MIKSGWWLTFCWAMQICSCGMNMIMMLAVVMNWWQQWWRWSWGWWWWRQTISRQRATIGRRRHSCWSISHPRVGNQRNSHHDKCHWKLIIDDDNCHPDTNCTCNASHRRWQLEKAVDFLSLITIILIVIIIVIIQIHTTSSMTVTGGRGFSVVVGPGYIPGSVTSDSNITTIVINIIIFHNFFSNLIITFNVRFSFKKWIPYHFVNDCSWRWWSVEDGHLGVTMGWSGDRTCGRLWNIDLNQSWI